MADTDTVNVGCTHPLGMRLGVYAVSYTHLRAHET